jgi:hypothetical protein
MSEILTVIAQISGVTFIVTSMLAIGLSLSLLMAVSEEMVTRAARLEAIKTRQRLMEPYRG